MKLIKEIIVLTVVVFLTFVASADQSTYPVTQSDKAFYEQIQMAISTNNYSWLSEAVSYPIDVHLKNKTLHLSNQKDFQKNVGTIMSKHLKSVVQHQSADSLFKSWQGVMVGNGELWFSEIADEPEKDKQSKWVYKITALNLDVPEVISSKQN